MEVMSAHMWNAGPVLRRSGQGAARRRPISHPMNDHADSPMKRGLAGTPGHGILLVEDDDLDVIAFHRAVVDRGLDVELQRARNAVEAIEMLRLGIDGGRRDSMLIVLDLNMPVKNGLEFLAELRADPALENSVVFVFTSSDSPADMRRAYELHAAGYVVKDAKGDSTNRLVDLLAAYLNVVRLPPVGATVAAR